LLRFLFQSAMPRAAVLILLLAAACGRRETITGNWTGVVRPDGGATGSAPAADQATPGGATDAASTKSAAADLAPPTGAELAPPDAAGGGGPPDARAATGPEEPSVAARDASPELGDARSCPDAARCD
jgi:hypothetical protein